MKISMSQRKFQIVFPVICTLLGVLVTAILNLTSNYQQLAEISKRACVVRIDKQEEVLREKFSHLLVSITNFSISPDLVGPITESDVRRLSLPVITSATEVIAYATPELAITAVNIMGSFDAAINAGNDTLKRNLALQQAHKSLAGSFQTYYNALSELAKKRDECN